MSNTSSLATRSPHAAPGSVPLPSQQYSHQYSGSSLLQQQQPVATQQAHPSYPYPSPVSLGERSVYELQDPVRNGVVPDVVEYPTQRDYSLHYGGPPPPLAGPSEPYSTLAPAQGHPPFFPPNSPYANAEPAAFNGGGQGKHGSSSQSYAPPAPYPPVGGHLGGPPPPSAPSSVRHRAGGGMYGTQRPMGWPPPPPGAR